MRADHTAVWLCRTSHSYQAQSTRLAGQALDLAAQVRTGSLPSTARPAPATASRSPFAARRVLPAAVWVGCGKPERPRADRGRRSAAVIGSIPRRRAGTRRPGCWFHPVTVATLPARDGASPEARPVGSSAPVAQMDRASASEAEGHRFESCRACTRTRRRIAANRIAAGARDGIGQRADGQRAELKCDIGSISAVSRSGSFG